MPICWVFCCLHEQLQMAFFLHTESCTCSMPVFSSNACESTEEKVAKNPTNSLLVISKVPKTV